MPEAVSLTPENLTVLGLLLLALVLFVTEKLSSDVSTLLVLIGLVVSGILSVEEAFAGFGSEIIVVIGSIFVLSGALVRTGVMDRFGAAMGRIGQGSELKLVIVLMVVTAAVSAFLSNTTATAVLIPAVLAISKTSKVSASRLLMPLAFASMLGGTCTVIGTSANIASSGFIQRASLTPFSLFEFATAGLGAIVVGVLFMALVGRRLLPRRMTGDLEQDFQLSNYLSEIIVPTGSGLAALLSTRPCLGKVI